MGSDQSKASIIRGGIRKILSYKKKEAPLCRERFGCYDSGDVSKQLAFNYSFRVSTLTRLWMVCNNRDYTRDMSVI